MREQYVAEIHSYAKRVHPRIYVYLRHQQVTFDRYSITGPRAAYSANIYAYIYTAIFTYSRNCPSVYVPSGDTAPTSKNSSPV